MSEPIKYMDIKEFREMGLLVELNRTFLHPLGLALEVVVNDDGTETIGGIWDSRDDPEGYLYGKINEDKVKLANEFIAKKHEERRREIGFVYQPTGVGLEKE